jgi:hypothetical protein
MSPAERDELLLHSLPPPCRLTAGSVPTWHSGGGALHRAQFVIRSARWSTRPCAKLDVGDWPMSVERDADGRQLPRIGLPPDRGASFRMVLDGDAGMRRAPSMRPASRAIPRARTTPISRLYGSKASTCRCYTAAAQWNARRSSASGSRLRAELCAAVRSDG